LVFVSLTACLLWLLLMPGHGAAHTAILPRHFYLMYILLVLFMIGNFTGPGKCEREENT
jgi:hypothetical protein